MGVWLNKIKTEMYQFNNTNSTYHRHKYRHISEYILDNVIPSFSIDHLGYTHSRDDMFVIVSTNTRVFKIRRKCIHSYTENDNDCLDLHINKHYSEFLNIEEVTGMEYVKEED